MLKKYQIQLNSQIKSRIRGGVKNLLATNKRSFSALDLSGKNEVASAELVEKDISYFTSILNQKGAEHVLQQLDNAASSLDLNTKYGRELIKSKDEIVTRLIYQERSVDEHENVSNHICEGDLCKVYKQHLNVLEENTQDVNQLVEKSSAESQLIYQYKGYFFSSKYFTSPFLLFSLPSVLTWKYSIVLSHLFGSFSPCLFVLGAGYAALKRHQWLTAGSKISGAKLVTSLRLSGMNLLVTSTSATCRNTTHTLNLSSTKINKVENAFRRDSYYAIQDIRNDNVFVMPIDDNAIIDHKTLGLIEQLKKANDEYSLRNVLAQGEKKLIDLTKIKLVKSEVDQIARINILSQNGLDLTKLTATELNEKLNSISDNEVTQYLESQKNQINSSLPSIESSLLSVKNLLSSFGVNQKESVQMTQYLRKHFQISSVSNLSTMSKDEIRDAFNETVSTSEVKFDTLYNNIQTFFSSLGTK